MRVVKTMLKRVGMCDDDDDVEIEEGKEKDDVVVNDKCVETRDLEDGRIDRELERGEGMIWK